jgi:hypothetical protein
VSAVFLILLARAIKSQKEPKVRLNIDEANNQIPGKPGLLALTLLSYSSLPSRHIYCFDFIPLFHPEDDVALAAANALYLDAPSNINITAPSKDTYCSLFLSIHK